MFYRAQLLSKRNEVDKELFFEDFEDAYSFLVYEIVGDANDEVALIQKKCYGVQIPIVKEGFERGYLDEWYIEKYYRIVKGIFAN